MSVSDANFYCSQKFTFLAINVEKRLISSCCTAIPEKIDIGWLKNNTGQMFNTPLLQAERQMMLDNIPVASCESNCWQPERSNITSRRKWMATDLRTHNNIKTTSPTTLSINLGSTCNLTCSYCCKQYSSSWRQDILTNGAYLDQDRFTITAQDKILLKLSQADHTGSETFNLILDETTSFDQLQTLSITGGEPFLYNKLPELLNRFSWVPHISITTGLGVNPVRFRTQLKKIKNTRNLEIVVSAENCNNSYEFNRYNNSWTNFLTNLEVIKNQKIKFNFTSVISNLTIFGLADFIDQFSEPSIINWCSDPEFLSVNVLDDASKKQIITQFKNKDFEISDRVISSIEMPCTEQQRQHLSVYLSEFAKRRQLSLDIFPASMLQWLKL